MTVDALVSDVSTDISSQVEHLILSLVIVRRRLDEEVFVSFILCVVPIMSERWKVVIEHSISIVLGNASKLNHAVHLFQAWNQVPFTEKVLEVLTIEFKGLLCLVWEPWMFDIFFPVGVFVHDEGRYESHDWFVERVHDH